MIAKITIDRFENETAVLKFDDGAVAFWPKEKMPDGLKEGSVLDIAIGENAGDEIQKRERARDVLNEILNID